MRYKRRAKRVFTVEQEESIVAEAKTLIGTMPFIRVCLALDVSEEWLRRRVYDGYSTRANARKRMVVRSELFRPLMPPPDTRDFTARFCGDPRQGRSALDKRRAGGE
jgi:hypothetical protein